MRTSCMSCTSDLLVLRSVRSTRPPLKEAGAPVKEKLPLPASLALTSTAVGFVVLLHPTSAAAARTATPTSATVRTSRFSATDVLPSGALWSEPGNPNPNLPGWSRSSEFGENTPAHLHLVVLALRALGQRLGGGPRHG